MVLIITGKSGAGKTTLAYKLKNKSNAVIIDGDEIRKEFPSDFNYISQKSHVERMAKFANILQKQGHNVIISAILPTKEFRNCIRNIIQSETKLIYIEGGFMWDGTFYEVPDKSENPIQYNTINENVIC